MSGIKDTATVTLNVNGAQAKQMMSDIEAKIKQTEAKITSLKANMADPKDIEKARRQLRTYQKQLDEMKSATEGVNKALSNLDKATPRQLERALRTLNKQLKDMPPGTAVWDSHLKQINELKRRLAELRGEVREQESVWTRFKNWSVTAWPAIDLLRQGYETVVGSMREYVDAYASMEQEMANVRKFTGMTADEVRDLNESLKGIDTRTSREELNKLAQEAGRLGLSSQEDVLGFVRAADKINVALDDLGEGATLTLSKLTDMFGDKNRYGVEQSLLKTGSVINELSQSSSAAAPYIAHFAERMSGVAVQAKLTVPQIMAMGAVLDSMGQKVEASSTAVSQVLVRMMQDPAKYAQVAGLEIENFTNLLRTDANEALLVFLDTLNKAGGLDVLAPMFKDMGENGSRAIATLTTLAKNIDVVRQRQQEANTAFAEGTSIDKEFAVQNTTVQASIEKAQKRFQELRIELGEKLAPLMGYVMTSASAFAKAINVLVSFVIKYRVVILTLTTAIASYYAAVGLATVAQKAWNAAILLGRSAVTAFKYTVGLLQVGIIALTHGTKAAGTAFTFLNASMKANPFGLVISLLATLAVVIYKVVSATDQYTKDMKEAMKAAYGFSEASMKEQKELDKMVGRLEGAQKGTKAYEDAKQAIINQYGQYLQGLIDERGEITNLEEAYKRLTYAIRQNAKVRGIENARQGVTDTFTTDMVNQLLALRDSLANFGADDRTIERIVSAVQAQIDSGIAIPQNIQTELSRIQVQANMAHLVDRDNTPVAIFNRISARMDDYNARLRTLDVMEHNANPAKNAPDAILASAINGLERAIEEMDSEDFPGALVPVIDASGSVTQDYRSREEIEELLQRYRWEQGNRNAPADDTDSTVVTTVPPGPTDPTKNTDPYAAEKAWRQRQEAEARIAYAKGETTYAEHADRMADIAMQYHQKLLNRDDLSADERLRIQADYWESVNTLAVTGNKLLLSDEDANYQTLLDQLRTNHAARLNQEGLTAEQRQQENDNYAEALELAELRHLQNVRNLYQEGSEEWLAANRTYEEKQIAARERHLKRMEALEKQYASMKDRFFGDNPQERQAKYDKDFAALQTVYARELAAAGNNAEERLRIEEAFLQAQNALRRQYGLESEEDTRSAMQRAVDSQIEWLKDGGGKAITAAVSTLTSGMSSIFSGLSTLIQAELEIQTAQIEKRYDHEVQLAQGNSYKVAKLEKKKDADIAKAKNEANKKLFAMQVIQAVAQTAQNAISAYGAGLQVGGLAGLILAPIAAAMAVAAGGIQIAAIKKQQQASEAQGYSKGGFTKPGAVDEPAGVVHAGEWVASQKLLANPVARPMIDALDYAQRTNTIGSLRPDDVSRSITANNSLVRIAEGDGSSALMVAAAVRMSQTVDSLTDRLNEPFVTINTVTGDHGINAAKSEYDRLMSNKSPKSRKNAVNN